MKVLPSRDELLKKESRMTTSELIRRLQEADPSGEVDVTIGNSPVHAAERLPAYYDGPKLVVFPGGRYPDRGLITNKGFKVRLTPITAEILILDNPDFPIEIEEEVSWIRPEIDKMRLESRTS